MNKMENPKIELIEEEDYESREKLLQRERWWIENNECINLRIPTRTEKEWREATKEYKKQYRKEHYEANKEKIANSCKEYREANKEHIKERMKEWREANRERIKEKIECECGLFIRKDNIAQHRRTNRHNKLIKKNNN